MLTRKLYLQICTIFVASLIGFAILASIAWAIVGHDQADSELFRKSSALSELLLPPLEQGNGIQKRRLMEIHDALGFDLALYDKNGELITFAGNQVSLSDIEDLPIEDGWSQSLGGTHWETQLEDGRILAIHLERIQLPGESGVFVIFLMIIAIGIALIIYPFIRHLTGRLERLQLGVQRIGDGDFDARVIVEGRDEVAQLAESFNEAAQRIQSLVRSQQLLLANTSHELRTPLSRIRVGIELLKKNSTAERLQSLLDDMSELDLLIEEVMMMARIDADIELSEIELFDILALAAEEGARYSDCHVTGESALIKGNRRMIQHAIRNLIDNGFKHGTGPVEIIVRANDGSIKLSVHDNGEGVANMNINELLQPFQRGKGKQNIAGFGLGLALVKKVMDIHNGDITLNNKKGLIVTLTFERGECF